MNFFFSEAFDSMKKSLQRLEEKIDYAEKANSLCAASLKDSKSVADELQKKLDVAKGNTDGSSSGTIPSSPK